ncbi:MAG: prolyl oligopeptidase family serine peptidase [Pseudomonadota bacterium]
MRKLRWGLAAAALWALAGCVVGPMDRPVSANEFEPVARTFSPKAARDVMDALNLQSPGRISPVFSADGSRFAFTIENELKVVHAATGEQHAFWTLDQLATIVGAPKDKLSINISADPFEALIDYEGGAARLPLVKNAVIIDAEPKDPPRIVREMFPMSNYDRRENISRDGLLYASLRGQDLALRAVGSDEIELLTRETNPRRVWFHGNDIWEQSGDIWSPDSSQFVARLHDSTATPGIDLIDYLDDGDEHSRFAYWARAGQPLPRTELYIVDVATGALTRLGPAGTTDDHLFFIEWSPDGESVLAIRYARDLSQQEIIAIDAKTGAAKTLVSRTTDTGWVKWPAGPQTIQHLPGGGYLLRSDESGFFQYSVLDEDGRKTAALTTGDVDVGGVIGFSPIGDWLYYYSPVSSERPYDLIPHRVSLGGGAAETLSLETGIHRATLSPTGEHIVTVHSDYNRASRADLLTADGDFVVAVAQTETPETINGAPLPERFIVRASDGETLMHGTLMKPRDFDPAKSYPVIQRVYGGMQSRVLPEGFLAENIGFPGGEYNGMLNYLADAGFVIVTMDAPGTPGRGRDYNLTHWGDWPGNMPDDYAAGLMELAETRPWMDTSRIAIDGNSWGGYVALFSALERPDIYKSVSISVPETDLLDHVHWIEWQLGTPENNPYVYANGNLADRMSELESYLLVVAGTSDVNVPISNTMKLLDGLAEAGKPYDLVIFPGTNHPHQGRGDRYAYAVERIRGFHDAHLRSPQAESP